MTATTIGRPGRNEACHGGSGRKYKQCCLEKDNAEASAARKAAAESIEQSSVVSETSDAATVKTVRSPKPRAISRGRRRPTPVASVTAHVRRAKPGELARPAARKRECLYLNRVH